MSRLSGRKIVLGVCGSIAAYKSLYLLRLLTLAGAEVAPILTRAATRFVGPMSFSALAGRAAVTDLWTAATQGEVGHVELAHWADLVVVAPSSADALARIANGRADDPLAAVALSTDAPLLFAPAMEDNMWRSADTQSHVAALQERGAQFVAPESGSLASGRSGAGRLAEPERIVVATERALTPPSLTGRRILVTAGPTREHADPVRFLSNPSTGRMGFALAHEAALRGALVTRMRRPVREGGV
ncbi:MAG: bifunctional phosphopantothenoylcysteine decarboxylase/phosphopantothenate--cysteine ligase CoaBC, partial [Myxococcota bacterium]